MYNQAVKLFKQSIKTKSNILAYCGIAFAYYKLGKNSEAISNSKKAKQLRAHLESETFGKVIADCGLGRVYLDLCNYEEAKKYFKKAIKRDSNFADSFFYLGMAYLKDNHTKEAIKQYSALKKIDIEKAKELFSLINNKNSIKHR